jgi:hypothetical protein
MPGSRLWCPIVTSEVLDTIVIVSEPCMDLQTQAARRAGARETRPAEASRVAGGRARRMALLATYAGFLVLYRILPERRR